MCLKCLQVLYLLAKEELVEDFTMDGAIPSVLDKSPCGFGSSVKQAPASDSTVKTESSGGFSTKTTGNTGEVKIKEEWIEDVSQKELGMSHDTFSETYDPFCHCLAIKEEPASQIATETGEGSEVTEAVTRNRIRIPSTKSLHGLDKGQQGNSNVEIDREANPKVSGRGRVYSCHMCSMIFKFKYKLREHTWKHTDERLFVCDQCGAKFILVQHLKRHKKIHTGNKPYVCDTCESRFREHSHLKQHRRIHTGEKPFSCDVCGSKFTQTGSLKAHRRIHTGDKPYSCRVCGSTFKESGNLRRHMITHTAVRPHCCDFCGARYRRYDKLKNHMRTHIEVKP